ncbi:MAG: polysulfide reductase NrfD [Nitrososphaerota archaeon]|nr:polysulfide reductase NrfD [Nitrososphaerota archaeon]MDG7023821.1 polysulfide reductase NrfD [Nitrososphaerota archaeon]
MTLPWGIYIASYLFLGGAAGGAFLIGGIQDLRNKGKRVAEFAGLTSFAAIVFGLVFLLIDLGRPLDAFNAFNQPTTSVMAFGTWIISGFALVSIIYTSFHISRFPWSRSVGGRKAFAVLGMILALITMYYTGLLLGVILARPLWSQALIPILFTVSGASTGIALVEIAPKVMASRNRPDLEEETKGLAGTDMLLMAAEAFIVISLLYVLYNSTVAASQSVNTWLTGSLSLDFWAGFVAIGLAVPSLLYAGVLTVWKRSLKSSAVMTALAGILVLVGGLVLRYIVLGAGLNTDFLQSLGFTTQTTVSFGPSSTELVYTVGLFAVLAMVYVIGAHVTLHSKAVQPTAATISP